jgi:ribose transport system permease protein
VGIEAEGDVKLLERQREQEAASQAGTPGEVARRAIRNPIVLSGLLAVLLFVVGEQISPGFAAYGQILSVLRIAAFLGIIAAGQTIVIISGGEGIDLSVGKVATFAAIVAARVIEGQDGMLVTGVVVAVGLSALIGMTNGLGIAFLRIPPLVMTLGMIGVVQGIILVYTGGQPAGRAAPLLSTLVSGRTVFGIPGVLWVWLVVGALVILTLRRTPFGWRVYGMGANREAAYLSGINVRGTIVAVYTLSSALAAVGGIFLLGYTETVFLNLADPYMLPSIAAVVIGGTTLAGGVGGYAGTAVGAIVLTVLQSLLTTMRMDAPGRQIVNGLVLLLLLSVYGRQRRLRQ